MTTRGHTFVIGKSGFGCDAQRIFRLSSHSDSYPEFALSVFLNAITAAFSTCAPKQTTVETLAACLIGAHISKTGSGSFFNIADTKQIPIEPKEEKANILMSELKKIKSQYTDNIDYIWIIDMEEKHIYSLTRNFKIRTLVTVDEEKETKQKIIDLKLELENVGYKLLLG